MKKLASLKLNAKLLRILLIVLMFVVLIAGITGFIFALDWLRAYAVKTSELDAQANAGSKNLQILLSQKTTLAELEPIVQKAHKIVAESQSYSYQNEIISDLNQYAKDSGVFITGYSFDTIPDTTVATPGSAGDLQTTVSGLPAGIRATTVNVSLASPTRYNSAMKFIQQIEQNVTKMQIGNISMTRANDENAPADGVDLPNLRIQVYIR